LFICMVSRPMAQSRGGWCKKGTKATRVEMYWLCGGLGAGPNATAAFYRFPHGPGRKNRGPHPTQGLGKNGTGGGRQACELAPKKSSGGGGASDQKVFLAGGQVSPKTFDWGLGGGAAIGAMGEKWFGGAKFLGPRFV